MISRTAYSVISVTTPAPTVRPPSPIANRSSFSIATGVLRPIPIVTVSPRLRLAPLVRSHPPPPRPPSPLLDPLFVAPPQQPPPFPPPLPLPQHLPKHPPPRHPPLARLPNPPDPPLFPHLPPPPLHPPRH